MLNYVKIAVSYERADGTSAPADIVLFFGRDSARATAATVAELEYHLDRSCGEPSVSVYRHDPAFSSAKCVGGCEFCDPGRDERRALEVVE